MPDTPTPIARPWLPSRRRFAAAVREVWTSRMLSNFGRYSQLLEARAGWAIGHPAPLAVASCDIGMVLAWRALGVRDGEVILPSFTFCSTANALRWNGLEPIFADIDPRTLCLDPDDVRRRIGPRTVGIAAVHTFGCPAAVDELQAIATTHGLKLLFDAAHGLGATSRRRPLGGFGDASVYSLSGTKLVCAGEGGIAAFRDSDTAMRFRELRGYGFLGDYNCKDVGLNGKISELNAALGWLSLAQLRPAVKRRRKIAAFYRRLLPGLHFQEPTDGDRHAYKDFAVLFPTPEQRDATESALGREGIQTKRYFLPVHRMAAYADHASARLPVTDDVADRILCLPIYHDLAAERVRAIAAVVRRAVGHQEVERGVA